MQQGNPIHTHRLQSHGLHNTTTKRKAQPELGLLALWTRVDKLERRLEFNPQCQLPDTVPAGITDASGLNLSECALAVNALS